MAENDKQNLAHSLTVEEVFRAFETGENGIPESEVGKRKEKFGSNQLKEKKDNRFFKLIIDQINNPIIYLLLAAAALSFIFKDIPSAIAILVVIFFNTVIGFWMEYQAMVSVKALKKLDTLHTHVRRGGEIQEIDTIDLVPGDIVILESGDMVPADARIIMAAELKVDESPLTGESVPVEKNEGKVEASTPLADRTNMLFKGTAMTGGKTEAIVTAIGQNTEIGKISSMVHEAEDEEIPLNKKLTRLSHKLIWATLGLALLYFVIGWMVGEELYLLLQTSIAWMVAAIPEGLPIVSSIALARGMLRLSKKNVLVKKLASVETLGETTVIFTDKTGTLTENELSVNTLSYSGHEMQSKELLEGQNEQAQQGKEMDQSLQHIFRISVLCNDAEWVEGDKLKGDPLDASLHRFAQKLDESRYNKMKSYKRVHEDPFDSESKFMGTVHEIDGSLYVAGKGAPEPMLKRSKYYLDGGEKKELDDDLRKEWIAKNDNLSAKGLRIIAFAYKELGGQEQKSIAQQDDFVKDMVFTGFVGFLDPPRYDVKPALEQCFNAGIKVVMVTGDHPEIAKNIAEKVKLTHDEEILAIEGKYLDNENENLSKAHIFARVDPKQKLDIIDHFKNKGEITAMTGDGVNDAPALQKSDIGIAMGDRGAQVAQDVADMVLKDGKFPSIVNAIEQGRIIFGNIRKFIVYQLSNHLAEIIVIAAISFTLFYLPLLPLQLLFLNLLSDVFPALALGLGKGNSLIMQNPPKDPDEPIITRKNWISIIVFGSIMAVGAISIYLLSYFQFDQSKEMANTVAFFGIAFSQLAHVFNMRDPGEKLLKNQVTGNSYVWYALFFCTVVLITAYLLPFLSNALKFEVLDFTGWSMVAGAAVFTFVAGQLVKKIFKI
jgi:P-type Ca2+ transporter type 2C